MSRETEVTPPARGRRELGLFVIWEKGRHHERRILADLESRFEILDVCEMHWASSAKANFARFYADIAVRGVYHVLSKGAGRFLVITVADTSPRLEYRQTSRGSRIVNARFFDAKQCYRSWEGAELGVHCSETRQELDRDLMLLLGVSADRYLVDATTPWRGEIERRRCDLVGAHGWSTWQELFHVLNHAVYYTVLEYPEPWQVGNGPRLALLTDDCRPLCRIANARPTRRVELHGGGVKIEVGGERILASIRCAGDGCYDPRWCRDVLASRVFDKRGFYTAAAEDRFWMLAYDALVRRDRYSGDCARYLVHYACSLGSSEDFTDARAARVSLDRFMRERRYECTRPLDPAEPLEADAAGGGSRRRRARAAALPVLDAAIEGYWNARDVLLLRAPWVRSLKRLPRVAKGLLGGSTRSGRKPVSGSTRAQ